MKLPHALIQNSLKHLRGSFFGKIVNGYVSVLYTDQFESKHYRRNFKSV